MSDGKISSNRQIAKNTIFLYFRMLFALGVSLFTSRVILQVLGIEDRGIYEIVGGVVGLFGFLNASLAGATSRFLTFELGKGNGEKLKETFAAALNIHIFIAFIVFVLAETAGLWFLNTHLNIPAERMFAANWVYQFSVISTMLAITQVPYNASLIAHERMGAFAFIGILDVLLKLVVCYALYVCPFDKLIAYALLILAVSITIQLIYRAYCIKYFEECHFKIVKDKTILKPIFSFAGWDLIGNLSVVVSGQGGNIILNLFFGPAINAAAGFAGQVNGAIGGFAGNFLAAIRPPIVKAYAANDIVKMENLMINASKFAFALLLFFSVPVIFESRFIINLWLKNPPEYTDIFSVFALLSGMVWGGFQAPLMFAIHATGKIRLMSFATAFVWISSAPATYFLLYLGFSPVSRYIVMVVSAFLATYVCLYCLKRNVPAFRARYYFFKTAIPQGAVFVLSVLATYLVYRQFAEDGFVRLFFVGLTSSVSIALLTFFVIFDKETRSKTILILKRKICFCGGCVKE